MNAKELRNILAIMRSIDGWELPHTWKAIHKDMFMRDPYGFFLRADHIRQREIWEVIERRSKARTQEQPKATQRAQLAQKPDPR